MLITMKRRCFKVFSGATPVIGDKSACHGTACYFLSSRPADSVAWRRPASSRPGQAGWEPECPGEGSEFGSPALRPRYRPAPAGRMRAANRGKSALWAAAAATCRGFARFGRCPIHMIIGESAGSASSGRLLSALGLAGDATHSCWPETEPVQQKQQSAWQTTSAFIRVPPPQQWVKSGLTLPK